LWRLYLVGTLLTLPTIAKLGASSNYWLELTAASAAALALASHRLAAWPLARPLAPTIVAGALLVAVPGYQATAVEAAANLSDLIQPTQPRYLSLVADIGAAPYRVEAHFIDKIAHEPGDLLTDNSGLAVAAGKRVEYEFQIFQLLHVEGLWSEQPILDAIDAQSAQRRLHPRGRRSWLLALPPPRLLTYDDISVHDSSREAVGGVRATHDLDDDEVTVRGLRSAAWHTCRRLSIGVRRVAHDQAEHPAPRIRRITGFVAWRADHAAAKQLWGLRGSGSMCDCA